MRARGPTPAGNEGGDPMSLLRHSARPVCLPRRLIRRGQYARTRTPSFLLGCVQNVGPADLSVRARWTSARCSLRPIASAGSSPMGSAFYPHLRPVVRTLLVASLLPLQLFAESCSLIIPVLHQSCFYLVAEGLVIGVPRFLRVVLCPSDCYGSPINPLD